MGILSCIGLEEKEVISIVGAGGKTSLLFQLGKDLKKDDCKVLLTTTTKIYRPKKEAYDFLCIDESEFLKVAKSSENGIYVYGTKVNEENKIIGLTEEQLDKLLKYFDYILIEADGSKKKQIKGWNENEPVVYKKSTRTIGVLDIRVLGMDICERNVHRKEAFCRITYGQEGEKITYKHLVSLIVHPQGLFKNSKGEKILFINKADDLYDLNKAKMLKEEINKSHPNFLEKIIIGSIKNNLYYR